MTNGENRMINPAMNNIVIVSVGEMKEVNYLQRALPLPGVLLQPPPGLLLQVQHLRLLVLVLLLELLEFLPLVQVRL